MCKNVSFSASAQAPAEAFPGRRKEEGESDWERGEEGVLVFHSAQLRYLRQISEFFWSPVLLSVETRALD